MGCACCTVLKRCECYNGLRVPLEVIVVLTVGERTAQFPPGFDDCSDEYYRSLLDGTYVLEFADLNLFNPCYQFVREDGLTITVCWFCSGSQNELSAQLNVLRCADLSSVTCGRQIDTVQDIFQDRLPHLCDTQGTASFSFETPFSVRFAEPFDNCPATNPQAGKAFRLQVDLEAVW